MNNMISRFFCKEYEYEPVGMFSLGHILILIIFLLLVAFLAYKCCSLKEEKIILLTKSIAIIVTILEIIKIVIQHVNGEGDLIDHWLPLYFCSMFIYATWMAGFGKGIIQNLGKAFIGTGGIIAGMSFLIFPTTSFTMYPLFHYFCLYSMVYHSLMVFLGIVYLINGFEKIDKKSFVYYIIFCSFFNILAIIVNAILDTNFMFLKRAGNIPISLVVKLEEFSPTLFTIFMFVVCIFGTYFIIWLICLVVNKMKKRRTSE
jgi:putative membrane protein